MDGIVITFAWLLIIAVAILLWFRSKNGKKWLENL